MPDRLRVLILDDDPDDVLLLREAIQEAMDPAPVEVTHVDRVRDAEDILSDGRFDVAFFDYHLGLETGLDLLKQLDRRGPLPCPVIVLTGQGNEEVAVDAMKAGATDYILKDNLNIDLVALAVRRALRADEDRRRRREAEGALERLRRQYELILRSAGEGIMGLDRAGRITFVNPTAISLSGWEEKRLKGRDAHRILHRTGTERGACDYDPCPLLEAIEEGKFRESTDDRFWRSDGITFPVRYVVTPILEEGVRVGSVVTFSDTTMIRQGEEARRLATERLFEIEQLKEIDRFRRQFLSTASTELSAPLAPIKTQLHLLKQYGTDDLDPDRRRAFEIIDRNAQRLGQLTQDLMDVSRIQSDNLRIHRTDTDIAALVESVIEARRTDAEAKGVELRAQLPRTIETRADPERVRQVVHNVVDNAIKFTPSGGAVDVRTEVDSDEVRITVSDTGNGVAEEERDRVFLPFRRLGAAGPGEGAGLGLYIGKGLVEAHGGRIWIDGREGGGTAVHIALPLIAVSGGAPAASDASAEDENEGAGGVHGARGGRSR